MKSTPKKEKAGPQVPEYVFNYTRFKIDFSGVGRTERMFALNNRPRVDNERQETLALRLERLDPLAAAMILEDAIFFCAQLESAALTNPLVFKGLAEQLIGWPIVMSKHPERQQTLNVILTKLKVGSKNPVNTSSKARWNAAQVVFSAVAIQLLDYVGRFPQELKYLEKMRAWLRVHPESVPGLGRLVVEEPPLWMREGARLPPLSPSTFENWWKIAGRVLHEYYPEPEKVPELLRGLDLNSDAHGRTPGKIRARIRDLIKRRFRSLMRK